MFTDRDGHSNASAPYTPELCAGNTYVLHTCSHAHTILTEGAKEQTEEHAGPLPVASFMLFRHSQGRVLLLPDPKV